MSTTKTDMRHRTLEENCWCGALAGEPCLAIRAYFPMTNLTHVLPDMTIHTPSEVLA